MSAWVKTRLRRDLFPAVCKSWAPDPRARAGWVLFDEARRQQTTGLITERRLRRAGMPLVSMWTFLVRPMVRELRSVAKNAALRGR